MQLKKLLIITFAIVFVGVLSIILLLSYLQPPEAFSRGVDYYDNGDYYKALEYTLKAKDIYETKVIKDNSNYTKVLNNLGVIYGVMGDYSNAEQYHLKAKAISEKVLGKKDEDYALSLNYLGSLYSDMGKYIEAEKYCLEAVSSGKKIFGEEHEDYALSIDNLGQLYKNMGDFTKAEQYHLEAKAIREKVLGKEHEDYAGSLNGLGLLYASMGDYDKAESCYLEAINIYGKVFGKEHYSYSIALGNLGYLYLVIKDYDNAEFYILEAKNIVEKVLGKDNDSYAGHLNNLGMFYAGKKDYAKAESCYLEAMAIDEKVIGKKHPDYARILDNLGLLYYNIGDYTMAEHYLLETKAILEKALGKEHPKYGIFLNDLGQLYEKMGDTAKSEQYYLEARSINEKALEKIVITQKGFVFIKGGTFTMGSPRNEPEREKSEVQHQVTVSSFYMGKYEVTQKEYMEIMGTNPSSFKGDNLPVEQVNWYDAIEYCNKRSQKEGLTPAYAIDKSRKDPNNKNDRDSLKWTVTWNRSANGYRLPTEAEWEYGCRAGTTTPFYTGKNITTGQANYYGHYPYNNNAKGEYREKTIPVGNFKVNLWGLYDMHGNVAEWCWDWRGDYSSEAQIDPVGVVSGADRVLRGGCWSIRGEGLRSACRGSCGPWLGISETGFRLVRNE